MLSSLGFVIEKSMPVALLGQVLTRLTPWSLNVVGVRFPSYVRDYCVRTSYRGLSLSKAFLIYILLYMLVSCLEITVICLLISLRKKNEDNKSETSIKRIWKKKNVSRFITFSPLVLKQFVQMYVFPPSPIVLSFLQLSQFSSLNFGLKDGFSLKGKYLNDILLLVLLLEY